MTSGVASHREDGDGTIPPVMRQVKYINGRSLSCSISNMPISENLFIPLLLQNPKVLVGYDAEVVGDLVAEFCPFLRDGFTHKCKDGVGELLLTWVVAVVGNVLMQDSPKPLNRIEMRAIGWQLDQMDTASCLGEEGSDIGSFVVGSVVPDDMNDALVRVALLDLGEKLHGTDPVDGCGLDKGCIESFEVYSPMNVHTTAPCCAENRWI